MRVFTEEEIKELSENLDEMGCSEEDKKKIMDTRFKVKLSNSVLKEKDIEDAEFLGVQFLKAFDDDSELFKDWRKLTKADYEHLMYKAYKCGDLLKRMAEQIRAYQYILKEASVDCILQRETQPQDKE